LECVDVEEVLKSEGRTGVDEPPGKNAGPSANDVRPADLGELIDKVDKLVVLETPRQGEKVLFESADRRDLDALKSALKADRPKHLFHCMCDLTPALVLYAKGEWAAGSRSALIVPMNQGNSPRRTL
jgi:hypothetical protein